LSSLKSVHREQRGLCKKPKAMWKLLVAGSCIVAGQAEFQFQARHACGVCREVEDGEPCERYGACHVVNTSTWVGCDSFCRVSESSSSNGFLHSSSIAGSDLDIRVAKAFGTKEYDLVRISVISNTAAPPVQGFFDYSEQFKFKWTGNYLHTSLRKVQPGGSTTFDLGQSISVSLPAQGAGVAGLLIADPCVSASGMWISCAFGDKYKTMQRTPELISTFASDKDTNFWGILGDNFYDRTGEKSKAIFSTISTTAKSKIFVAVPGNHDYWVLGTPLVGSDKDQCGNGFMQFYGQDTKAAASISIGDNKPPFDFSTDPHRKLLPGCKVAAMQNFFWYNQVGNVGMIGQSGAYSLDQAMPFMKESCAWLSSQTGLQVVLLYGHWDKSGLGAASEMAMPKWYEEMAALPGCAEFHKRGMLKFVMGHTHCNDPHPHGNVGAGFRVAGFGMDGGCGNYGAPLVDTTGGRVRFWYFDLSSDDKYSSVITCVQQKGWRSCTSMASLWLDEPINTTTASMERVVV